MTQEMLDTLHIPDWAKELIVQGENADNQKNYNGDRSRAVYAVVCECVRAGMEEATLEALLLDPGLGIRLCLKTDDLLAPGFRKERNGSH